MKIKKGILAKRIALTASLFLVPITTFNISNAATVASDGGITFYLSYDNLNVTGGVSWNDNITQSDSNTGASCTPTNTSRANQGAPNSPGSCPSGDTCLGREKLIGDLDNLAEYIYQSTDGRHYLRRVYLSDNGRAWNQSDIKWNVGSGGSFVPVDNDWQTPFASMHINSGNRRCIHDVAHHEMGHYFYNLPDRYASSGGYYSGTIGGGAPFDVAVDVGDPNTVMGSNFPHWFVDTTNAQLTLSYTPSGGSPVNGQVLTPALLADSDPSNDGPNRAHHGYTHPFAQDEWSYLPGQHADLSGVHTEGDFSGPDMTMMPSPDYRFLGEDSPYPGTMLLLDRSGSMGTMTNGITAAQYVQEAGMFLYHSSLPGDFVGTNLYNGAVETLFDYEVYDPSNQLPYASFRSASGLTNIAAALKSATDAMVAEHGMEGVNGGKIVLMSDGKQTTGLNLWDEVTRAEDLGIEIYTLSFGNADTATMEAIATATGGEVIAMSELNDGSELKLGMARELSELRGLTPLFFQKQVIKPNAESKKGNVHEGTFNLPVNSRALQFYSFLEKGNAALFDLELEDSAGNIFKAQPQNVANKGRLNGLTVTKPLGGKWTYRISGSKRHGGGFPGNDPFELIAYTQNLDLDATMQIVPAVGKLAGQSVIQGRLYHRYPLMNISAIANVYSGKTLLASLPLKDNGKQGVDATKNDGVYSALFDPRQFDLHGDRAKVRIDVSFTTNSKTQPAIAAHYETGTDLAELAEDYAKSVKMTFTSFASDTVSFKDVTKLQPRISVITPQTPVEVKPGLIGKMRIAIDNTYIPKNSARVSLGQGVRVKVGDVSFDHKNFRSYVSISYEVLEAAVHGYRSVSVQSNRMRVSADKTLFVASDRFTGKEGYDAQIVSPQKNKINIEPMKHNLVPKNSAKKPKVHSHGNKVLHAH